MVRGDERAFPEVNEREPRIGRPNQDAAERIEPDLLATTWRIFVEQGYARTTIDAVARDARMSKRTIYDRFASKESLIEASIAAALNRWRAHVRASLTHSSAGSSDWMEEFVRRCLEILVAPEGSALMGFLIVEDESFDAIRETVSAAVSQSVGVFSDLLMQRTPDLPAETAKDISFAVLDLLIGYSTRLNALHPQVAMEQVRARAGSFTEIVRALVEVQSGSFRLRSD